MYDSLNSEMPLTTKLITAIGRVGVSTALSVYLLFVDKRLTLLQMQAVHICMLTGGNRLGRHRQPSHPPTSRHPLGSPSGMRIPCGTSSYVTLITQLLISQIILKIMAMGFIVSFTAQVTSMVYTLVTLLRQYTQTAHLSGH